MAGRAPEEQDKAAGAEAGHSVPSGRFTSSGLSGATRRPPLVQRNVLAHLCVPPRVGGSLPLTVHQNKGVNCVFLLSMFLMLWHPGPH